MGPGILLPSICVIITIVALLVVAIAAVMSKFNPRAHKSKTQGVIHVDYSDPVDGPHLFLELRIPVADIVSRKRVILDVDTTQYYSHE